MASPGRRGLPARGGDIRMVNDHAEVIRLRTAGHSYRAIARITGYHHTTVWSIVRQHLAELAPTREDADLIRSQLFAEHEMVKDQLMPFVLADEDAEGNPLPPDMRAVTAHLARSKEQAALYHLHGRQDDVTCHGGETPIADEVIANTNELTSALEALGLGGQPVLDESRDMGVTPIHSIGDRRSSGTEGGDDGK